MTEKPTSTARWSWAATRGRKRLAAPSKRFVCPLPAALSFFFASTQLMSDLMVHRWDSFDPSHWVYAWLCRKLPMETFTSCRRLVSSNFMYRYDLKNLNIKSELFYFGNLTWANTATCSGGPHCLASTLCIPPLSWPLVDHKLNEGQDVNFPTVAGQWALTRIQHYQERGHLSPVTPEV